MSMLKKAVPYLISGGVAVLIIVGMKRLAPGAASKLGL